MLLTCLLVLVQASVCLVYFCLEGFDLLLSWGQEISGPPRIRMERRALAWVPRNCFLLSPDRFHPPVVVVAFERAWEKGEASFGPPKSFGWAEGRERKAWERGGKGERGRGEEKEDAVAQARDKK